MMMEVLITFPLQEENIDLQYLDEIMLLIYQPRNIYDDRFERINEEDTSDSTMTYKPLLFTQKSAANHVIIDGIYEISFHLNLPRGTYVYLHKQRDKLLLNDRGLITTLGNGRKVNYVTADEGGGVSFETGMYGKLFCLGAC